jgi:hypothetical protein
VIARAPDGRELFRGPVAAGGNATAPENGRSTAARTPRPGEPAAVTFDAPAGRIEITSVHGSDPGGATTTLAIEIPEPGAGGVVFDTPRFYVARTGLDLRAIQQDADAPPTPVREFDRSVRVIVRVSARDSSGPVDLEARLLNRAGRRLSELPVSARTGGGAQQLEIPLSSLVPAEYVLELRVASGGESPPRELVAFRVGR